MDIYNSKDSEIRAYCREKIESLEHWLRRLIDETLTTAYSDYFSYDDGKGNRIINKKLSEQAENRQKAEPLRYPRKIDAILLEDAVQIICNPSLYKHFKPALNEAFPDGAAEARTFMNRLLEPRNNLAHANAISTRQAEQIICYSNDIIDSLKGYYKQMGMQQDFNVPLIFKVKDSFGNVFTRDQLVVSGDVLFKNLNDIPQLYLRPGDTLTIEIEVDAAFGADTYDIYWRINSAGYNLGNEKESISIIDRHIGLNFEIFCEIISHKHWHRFSRYDDHLTLRYRVLPPIE